MRGVLLVVPLLLAACGGDDDPATTIDAGDDPIDAADVPPDAPDDPFEGMFDDPSDFPRAGCVAGSLAGFDQAALWPGLTLRTATDGGLATYIADFIVEREAAHTLSEDDLFVRDTWHDGFRWRMVAIDVCAAAPDLLTGSLVICYGPQSCFGPFAVVAPALHRIEGEADGQGLSLVGEWSPGAGFATNIRVVDDVAYMSNQEDGLRIVSIADPAKPVELAHFLPAGDSYNDVKVLDVGDARYAVVGGTEARIVDVTDPAAPALVATLPVSPHTFFVEGTILYLVDGYQPILYIYDLADPAAPVELAWWESAVIQLEGFHDLQVADGVAYISATYSGLAVVDVSDPASPQLVGFEELPPLQYWHSPWKTEVGGRPVVVHGDEFSGPDAGFRVQDVDPASPTFLETLGSWHLRDETSAHNVMAFGETVYMAHYHDGIRVIDLGDPAAPQQIGYFNTWIEGTGPATEFSGALGIDVDLARRRIYVADSLRGLMILEGDATVFPP